MVHDRRREPRFGSKDKVVVRRVYSGGTLDSIPIYLRDKGPGGMCGTCFGRTTPDVNEFLQFDDPEGGASTVRVVWRDSTCDVVHTVGFEFMHGPVAM
jgi:hypothetical protein